MTPEKRAELQRLLDKHGPVLEAQATVLKTVAKLIGPTVVHVEADVPQQPACNRAAAAASRNPAPA